MKKNQYNTTLNIGDLICIRTLNFPAGFYIKKYGLLVSLPYIYDGLSLVETNNSIVDVFLLDDGIIQKFYLTDCQIENSVIEIEE